MAKRESFSMIANFKVLFQHRLWKKNGNRLSVFQTRISRFAQGNSADTQ